MRNGILLIDKPAGITSAGVVARIKRKLAATRVGHAGTLDPDATGLLILLIEGATRVASYAADGYKVYSGEIELGVSTSTDDLAGEVIERVSTIPSWDEIQAMTQKLTGIIQQVPPKVSAIKVQGKRAHKRYRKGEEFELHAREAHVPRFDITVAEEPHRLRYVIECSPGTYVRALARDLGVMLRCGAAVATIRRERSGYFSVNDAMSLADVSWDSVRDWSDLLPNFPRLSVPHEIARGLLNGQRTALSAAWKLWDARQHDGSSPEYVIFSDESSVDSLGILKIQSGHSFDFQLNIPPRS